MSADQRAKRIFRHIRLILKSDVIYVRYDSGSEDETDRHIRLILESAVISVIFVRYDSGSEDETDFQTYPFNP
ncbi:MAG: hypothetical protein DRI57_32525 [Deltaproteobacteria bacterium]|nr:MAG: hypothetical protein DRI57_32525 [Deltaproteobacteria bacterium]